MKTLLESAAFRAELPGWALRGVLCAANSAVWAVLGGFQSPGEIAGMVAGVAVWVGAFALSCAALRQSAGGRLVPVVKAAAWLKIALTAGGWLVFWLGSVGSSQTLMQLGMLGTLDTLLGLAALAAVSFATGLKGPEFVAAADSFGLTTLTTLTEGALMALVIAGLALVLWLGGRICAQLGLTWKFLPSPTAG